PILGHIDPYGDTVLNGMQAETLLTEIARLRPEGGVIPAQFADALIELSRRVIKNSIQRNRGL
ncbi:MAG: hypothetical protein M3Y89_18060, partial [Actinomycetota bacterium]|nr:hypothetical protein [Actinomycetota bacterium]